MPLSFPASPTIGQQYSDQNGTVWKYNGFGWEPYLGSSFRIFNGAKVELLSNLNLAATPSAISWSSIEYNQGELFSTLNPTRFTAKDAGFYNVHLNLFTGSTGSGNSYTIEIKKNGTTVISTTNSGPNQATVYDEIVFFGLGDYVEIFVSESTASGVITTDTICEFTLFGSAASTTTFNTYNLFSGVKTKLNSVENLTNVNTAIQWDNTEFNVNADVSGNVYWTSEQSTNVSIYTTGYYRVQLYVATESGGSTDSYTINLRKNNSSTLESITLSPNDFISYDEIIKLNTNDYLRVEAAESGSAGAISSDSYITVTRVGI
jgi:hypothetical protein